MTLAEAASLIGTPLLFAAWGVLWALPRDLTADGKTKGSRWTEPRLVIGLLALVVAMNLGIVDVLGSLALRILVFALAPLALGFLLGRKIRSDKQGVSGPSADGT